ncbi:MAG: terminase small subunit [Candidatus Glassbacteria bacterium]|nr:terminase small subunit [Candidatus Glassbacteria bacterium]
MKKQTINGLTPRQERFCHELLVDFNATQAYRRAGFSSAAASAGPNASKLLKQDKIQKRLEELTIEQAERTKITSNKVLEEIGRLAFLNIKNYVSWDSQGNIAIVPSAAMSDEIAAGIAKIKQTRRRYHNKQTGKLSYEEVVFEFGFFKKEQLLQLCYRHLGLDRQTGTNPKQRKDLATLLSEAGEMAQGIQFEILQGGRMSVKQASKASDD